MHSIVILKFCLTKHVHNLSVSMTPKKFSFHIHLLFAPISIKQNNFARSKSTELLACLVFKSKQFGSMLENGKEVRVRSRDRNLRTRKRTSSNASRSSHRYSRSPSSDHKTSKRRRREDSSTSSSESPYKHKYKYSSYSRSRSYSPRRSDRSYGKRRSFSRSPRFSSRRKYQGNRENPQQSPCLGIFGLNIYTTEQQIRQIFSKYGNIINVQIVLDAKSGRSRGYGFIYFENCNEAKMAKEQCSGMFIDDKKIRVDYSITQRPHTPTPGVYMGRPTSSKEYEKSSEKYRRSSREHRYKRSPSPYYRERKRRYYRSRSRSYSRNR